jgi:hypothetical protein
VPNALNLLKQCSDVIIGNPGGWPAHRSRFDLEGLTLPHRSALRERHSKSFVYYRSEWTSGPSRFSLETGGDIIV